MGTIDTLFNDALCDDPGCDEIIRKGSQARTYRDKVFCLRSHDRGAENGEGATSDTWHSDRLDVMNSHLAVIAAALAKLADLPSPWGRSATTTPESRIVNTNQREGNHRK